MDKPDNITRDLLQKYNAQSCKPSSLLQCSLAGQSTTHIAREISRRLEVELKANGKTTFTFADFRRIEQDMFQGVAVDNNA